ncbi:MAG TPA: class I tRNA ligase family protein, partial [Candidatus Bathyarchaeia archaeon]|nr:class I tRNA ligase family protein [Candidatus Bathyarchaeia archaeon]
VGTRRATEAIDEATRRLVHKTIKKVTDDIASMSFNTAISAMMVLTNHLTALDPVPLEAARALALLISPFAPHLGEELWQRLGAAESLAHAAWPAYDEALTVDDVLEMAVQVNGKVRGRISLSRTASEDDARRPQYLSDLMLAFRYTNADIVGKRSYYIYLESRQLLGIRHPGQEYKFLEADEFLDGGKKIVKKKVYEEVQYRNVSTKEDVYFCEDCAEKGFTMFSADRYNLVYMRRKNKRTHTWKEQDRRIIKSCSVIGQTEQYKESAIL